MRRDGAAEDRAGGEDGGVVDQESAGEASEESDESDGFSSSPRSSKSAQTSTGDSRGGVGWITLRGVPSSDDDSSESTSSGAKDWYGSAV